MVTKAKATITTKTKVKSTTPINKRAEAAVTVKGTPIKPDSSGGNSPFKPKK